MEKVKFTTYDGVELAADLYLPEGHDEWSPGIIVLHGFTSRKENHAPFGEQAAREGFAALVVDLRGHGESGGEVDANIFNDVAAAMQYLGSRPEVNPMNIAIRGSSFGGWLAVHTAAHLRDIISVVAFAAPSENLLTMLMEEVALVQRGHTSPMVGENMPRINVNSTMQLLYRLDILKSARRISPRPLLLVHSEGDESVPPFMSQRLYDAVDEPKTLWLLPGGDHGFAHHDPETNKRVLDWLRLVRPSTQELSVENLPSD